MNYITKMRLRTMVISTGKPLVLKPKLEYILRWKQLCAKPKDALIMYTISEVYSILQDMPTLQYYDV